MRSMQFQAGDLVVYRKQKSSNSPGPRAQNVHASSGGEGYRYTVDKYWIVQSVEDDSLTLRTRRGKVNRVSLDDPGVRPPRLWERWIHRDRFDQLKGVLGEAGSSLNHRPA
ncbi:MAG: hypothetical protein AAF664_15930 [Planctomycetota bacterium]